MVPIIGLDQVVVGPVTALQGVIDRPVVQDQGPDPGVVVRRRAHLPMKEEARTA